MLTSTGGDGRRGRKHPNEVSFVCLAAGCGLALGNPGGWLVDTSNRCSGWTGPLVFHEIPRDWPLSLYSGYTPGEVHTPSVTRGVVWKSHQHATPCMSNVDPGVSIPAGSSGQPLVLYACLFSPDKTTSLYCLLVEAGREAGSPQAGWKSSVVVFAGCYGLSPAVGE